MRAIGAFVSILLLRQDVEGSTRIDPLVDTKVGLIRGLRENGGQYSTFLGIPFGKVDESKPFGVASPYPAFEDVYEAYNEPTECPQIDMFTGNPTGSLDCLRLNIYVPSSAHSKNRLPVLVWIHGGAFQIGNANKAFLDPKFLIKHDVIFVSLQYRLGPFGFMCLGTPDVPGNQGLKDQVLALRWINKNIEAFGGDTNMITVFGESAGAFSADLHLYSEQEKLFNNVILNSGSALVPLIGSDPDVESPLKLAEHLGLVTTDVIEALNFLSNTDPALVVAAAKNIDIMVPCVEKEFDNVERFLADYPVNMSPSKARRTSILIGTTSHESNLMDVDVQVYNYLKQAFDFDEERLQKMVELIKHFYLGDDEDDNSLGLYDFSSDYNFVYPAKRSIEKYIRTGVNKVFYFMFSYLGDRSQSEQITNSTFHGAVHTDDLVYLYDTKLFNLPETISPKDQLMIDRMTTMWTNFVKYGEPIPETSELLPVKWEPIKDVDSRHYYMNIDYDMQLRTRPYNQRTAFWDLFYEYNKSFQKGYKGN